MKYKLVLAGTAGELETEVTKLLANGWELHGFVFMTPANFCQAMTNNSGLPK